MSDETNSPEAPKPNISLPKFELPKAASPVIRQEVSAPRKPFVAPSIAPQRPVNVGAAAAVISQTKEEKPILTVLDALAAIVAVSFAIIVFLDK